MIQKCKITVFKIKTFLDGFKIRLETAKNKINELKDGSIRNKVKHRVWGGRKEWSKYITHKRNVGFSVKY